MTTVAGPLHRLPAIGLAELDARAALQTRVDRKYLLPDGEALVVNLPGARALEIDGSREAAYSSTYYDTDDLASYHLAARGRRRRFKVRERTYIDSGLAFVEVKTRGARGTTVKERVAAGSRADLEAFVADVLGRSGITDVDPRGLQPVLTTTYVRSTLYLPGDGARVTLDSALAWSLPDGSRHGSTPLVVVETKSGARPSAADRVLWRAGHRPTRISKYGTGLAALVAELPSNRWHATLHRHDLSA